MRLTAWVVCLIAFASATLGAEKLPPPDHTKANINGLQAVMMASAVENERGDFDPVRLPGCKVYLAPSNALHEHLSFPCNEWFLSPEGSFLVWLATDDMVSSMQMGLVNGNAPYKGGGSVSIHDMQPAGWVTVEGPVPADHTVRYTHLDVPGPYGFSVRASSCDAAKRFPVPPGRVVAGIFDANGDVVAYHSPLMVEAGETTVFRIVPPACGSDLVAILNVPRRHREGLPLDLAVKGAVSRAPDVRLDKPNFVVAVWYGLTEESVTLSATSPTLELKRDVDLRPGAVSTIRTELPIRENSR
jgi:hypothetical protein